MYIDSSGYKRFGQSKALLHRKIAKRDIYIPNRNKYIMAFSKYEVHHIDGNKLNNHVWNLELLTRQEHVLTHKVVS